MFIFRCIIGDQFARLKRGDKFFYSHKNQVGSFNEGIAYNFYKRKNKPGTGNKRNLKGIKG